MLRFVHLLLSFQHCALTFACLRTRLFQFAVHPLIELASPPGSKNSFVWTVSDFASTPPAATTFALRFKTDERKPRASLRLASRTPPLH